MRTMTSQTPRIITVDNVDRWDERIEFSPVGLLREVYEYGGKLACAYSWIANLDEGTVRTNPDIIYVGRLKPTSDVMANWKHKSAPVVSGYEIEHALKYVRADGGAYYVLEPAAKDGNHNEYKVCVPDDMFEIRGCFLSVE